MIHNYSLWGQLMLQQLRGHLSLRLPGCLPSGGNNSSSACHKAIWIKHWQKPIENTFPAVSSHPYKALAAASKRRGCPSSPENPSIPETAPATPDQLHMVTSSSSPGGCVGITVSFETLSTWPLLHRGSLSTPCLFFYRCPMKGSHTKPTK